MRRFIPFAVGTAALALLAGCENPAPLSAPPVVQQARSAVRNVSQSVTVGNIVLTDLGVLQPGGFARATAINNSGVIVGESGPFPPPCGCTWENGFTHGIVWDPTTQVMTDLGVSMAQYAGGMGSTASAISSNGWIAGSGRDNYWSWEVSVLLFEPPTYTLTALSRALTATDRQIHNYSNGINSSRLIVGSSDSFDAPRAFLWNGAVPGSVPNELMPLDPAGNAVANAINDAGLIVGSSYILGQLHPVRWDASSLTPTDLGLPPGWSGAVASAINDAGLIAGYGRNSAGEEHGFVYDPASRRFTEIGSLGGAGSRAYGINSTGIVVGWAYTSTGQKHPFAWDGAS